MGPTKDAALREEEDRQEELERFLKKKRPALTEAELIGLPEPKYGRYWSQEDEKKLDTKRVGEPERGHVAILAAKFTYSNTAAVLLWRVFPRLYRKLPSDLFSLANKIDCDTSATFGVNNIMWPMGFCDALAAFSINPFWTWNAEADFPLMAQLMQLVVRCRTNDCRRWDTYNYTRDTFIDVMIAQLDDSSKLDRTMKEIMDETVEEFEGEREGMRRPTEMQSLFRAVVAKAFKPDKPMITDDYPDSGEVYMVMAKDLQLLNNVLAEFGPSPDREGMTERLHGSTWKRDMTHARGKKAQSAGLLPHESEDISKVISLSLICRARDTIIASRKARHRPSRTAGGPRDPTGGLIWGDSRPFISDDDEDEDEDTSARQKRKKKAQSGKAKGKAVKAAKAAKGKGTGREKLDERGSLAGEDHRRVRETATITEVWGFQCHDSNEAINLLSSSGGEEISGHHDEEGGAEFQSSDGEQGTRGNEGEGTGNAELGLETDAAIKDEAEEGHVGNQDVGTEVSLGTEAVNQAGFQTQTARTSLSRKHARDQDSDEASAYSEAPVTGNAQDSLSLRSRKKTSRMQ
ncbi:hypothetical protein N0V82_003599 [Gnomoniopsis sp. IMI 355080]|nr:hypothetical protein N0V82_003599 [Gnomoniopsis sp. IMI 355080]